MIELVYSNKTEALLDHLAKDILELKIKNRHILEPVEIVAPNYNMETWITLGLAQRNSVAANLRFRRLERFIGDLIEEAFPGHLKLVEPAIIESAVLAALLVLEQYDMPEIKPLRDYLEGDGLPSTATGYDHRVLTVGKDLRRVQLAAKIAFLFQEYSFSRPEMVAAWRGTPGSFKTNTELPFGNPGNKNRHYAPVAAWQKILWQAVFGETGILNQKEGNGAARWVTLDQLVLDDQLFKRLQSVELKPMHIFGVSYVARIFQLLFARLGELCPLKIYALNPCAEFWEDLETDRELFRRLDSIGNNRRHRLWANSSEDEKNEDPFGLNEADSPALRYWGRPGREYMRLLGELTDCDFKSAFSDPLKDGYGLLQQIQQDILFRVAENDLKTRGNSIGQPDDSLKLVAAPSIRREVEWVADEIWKLIRANHKAKSAKPLRFNDIAIVINTATRHLYMPLIESAFAAAQKIPVNITDLPGVSGSRFIEALNLLLALPFGKFSRSEMLAVMSHPVLIAGFAGASPDDLAALAEKAGILYGADHSDHEGTYIDEDVYNWDQGIKRLVLGACMGGRGEENPGIFKTDSGRWLVEEITGAKAEAALKFGLLARSLIADAALVRDSSMLISAWADFFMSQVDTYLYIQQSSDEYDRQRVLRVLSKMKDMELGYRVSGRIATEIAGRALQSIQGGRGNYLTEGVVVSSFLPMRAIPFKVVFILGLGEGLFPAGNKRDSLDLRLAQRRAGDVDASERDRYMFLEALLCARDKLYLSYVKRDELTGNNLQPSTVIKELLYILEQGYLGENAREVISIEPPLRRYTTEGNAEDSFNDHIRMEQHIRKIADDIRPPTASTGETKSSLSLVETKRIVPAAAWEKLSAMLALPQEDRLADMKKELVGSAYPVKGIKENTGFSLTIANIRRFLECPMQGWAESMLGLPLDEESLVDREEEDFELNRKQEFRILRNVFCEASSGELDRESLYDHEAEYLKLGGKYQPGILGALNREKHLAIFTSWQKLLSDEVSKGVSKDILSLPDKLIRVKLQDHLEGSDLEHIFNPLLFRMPMQNTTGDNVAMEIKIKGYTEALLCGMGTTVILQPAKPPAGRGNISSHGKLYRGFLQGLVDHLLLSAAGITKPGEKDILVLYANGVEEKKFGLKINSLQREAALDYLDRILSDMINDSHAYLLPCEAILDHYLKRVKKGCSDFDSSLVSDIRASIFTMIEDTRMRYASLWGPVPLPQSYLPPDEDKLENMIKVRFEPILQQIISTEGF